MPRKTESSSNSSASLSEPTAPLHLTVPCSVKLDGFQQSSKKLVLKDGSGYYILRRESLRYKIEGIKVLRSRNRSMPTATNDRGSKMNRRDPRGEGFHHYSQSRDYQGDYHSRYEGRYSGPDRSRERVHRIDQRYWPPRGGRAHRNPYSRDHPDGPYGNRRSWSRDDSYGERRVTSPEGRFHGDRDCSFDERQGRYPDQRPERRKHHSGGSISQEAPKSLVSTYKKSNASSVENNHVTAKSAPEKETQSQKAPVDTIVNNDGTKQNHVCDTDKSDSPATTQSLSNLDAVKAGQGTLVESAKPSSQKPSRKGVLTMSQQIDSLKKKDKTKIEVTGSSTSKSNNNSLKSETGNGDNAKGSPHRNEISVQNHIDSDKSSDKDSDTISTVTTETVASSPNRIHTARKSAPSSSISRTQKSDMLKKQALLRSQSNQDIAASTGRSSPTARMGSGEAKPQRDLENGSPAPKEQEGSSDQSDPTSKTEEAASPKEDIATLPETEECKMETSSPDEGSPGEGIGGTTPSPASLEDVNAPSESSAVLNELESKDDKTSTGQSVPEVSLEESMTHKIKETEKDTEDKDTASVGSATTCETGGTVASGELEKAEESEKSPDVGKIKEKALLKLKQNLKKNLMKGKISPQNSLPSSRCTSRSNSSSFPQSPVDAAEVTNACDQMDVAEDSGANLTPLQHSIPGEFPAFGKSDTELHVNGKEMSEDDVMKPSFAADERAADDVDVDMADDKQTLQSDDLVCNSGETQTSQGTVDPPPDEGDHICNNITEDFTKTSNATEKPATVDSPVDTLDSVVDAEIPQETDDPTKKSSEASQKDALSLPKVVEPVGNRDELSDGSVDLGPNEPGDMDALDDDLLLEEESLATSEGYNPEPEKMEISEFSETMDSELSEIAIARVESHSQDVLQKVDPDQPSTSKRILSEGEEANGEPASKKSRTETEDIIEGVDIPEQEEPDGLDESKKPVIFTHNEWKEFAQSIKEKYEKLVQTFNQKTNVMYEAQACWQQETISWKNKYEELERKYDHLAVQVKEKPTVPKQSIEVQTTFTHRTKLSRKKKSLDKSPREEPMETDQGSSRPTDASTSSGTSQTTSSSSSVPDAPASNKSNNLESKRQVFKATLNKVMQSKKNLSGTSDSGSASTSPRATTPLTSATPEPARTPETSITLETSNTPELSKDKPEPSIEATAAAQEALPSSATDNSGKESPMDTSQPDSKSEPKSQSDTTPESESKGPNDVVTASGTLTAASEPKETHTSTPSPKSHTSKLPSQSDTTSSPAIPSPSRSPSGTAASSSPPKAQPEAPEKTKLPSATDSSKLPGSPKHSSSPKAPEASKDSSGKSVLDSEKDPSASKSAKPSQAQAEPEVIDLTDDPDTLTVSVSKSSAPIAHKSADAPPASKHSTLTTRSPHKLINTPAVPSPTSGVSRVTGASSVSSSMASPGASGIVTAGARQVQTSAQNPQNAAQRPGQRTFVVAAPRTGSNTDPVASPKRTSPGAPQNPSPNKPSSSGNSQLKKTTPPTVATLLQGANVRSQVVTLQHGQSRPQITAPQVTTSQVIVQQRQQPTTVAGLQPAPIPTSMQNQARVPGQAAIQQRIQQTQQQQQINLQMLQQGRQGVHQLPGAAAAALATRQPQPWLQQTRPQLQITSSQQQSLQVCQQIQLPTGQVQVQMVRPVSTAQTITTSALQSGLQQAIQKQQQIQAQERAHATSVAQAVAKAAREKREQEQHQQARAAAQRLQSSQLDQQQAQRAKIKNLQSEHTNVQTKAQQQQNKKRLLLNQIQRVEEYQRNLRTQLQGNNGGGMNRQVYQNCQKQLKEVQDQERQLRSQLTLVDASLVECQINSSNIEQQLRAATTANARLSPQEMQKHQLQQQQQQLSQQLAQRQVQQQRNQQLQQQQQQQQKQPTHPARLPDLTATIEQKNRRILFTPMPIKPALEIKHSQEGIVLSWKADSEGGAAKVEVKRYLLYAYQESESATPSTDLWKKIGAVDALPLPMACTLTHFKAGSMYHFAVCAISKHGRPGAFSNVGHINLP